MTATDRIIPSTSSDLDQKVNTTTGNQSHKTSRRGFATIPYPSPAGTDLDYSSLRNSCCKDEKEPFQNSRTTIAFLYRQHVLLQYTDYVEGHQHKTQEFLYPHP